MANCETKPTSSAGKALSDIGAATSHLPPRLDGSMQSKSWIPSLLRSIAVLWLGYLHLVWILQPDHCRFGSAESAREPHHTDLSTQKGSAYKHASPRAGLSDLDIAGVGPTAETAALAQRYREAADELLLAAQTQGPNAGAGYRQLSWHYNKAALDLDPQDPTAVRVAASIAEAGWPYWLSWPETQQLLEAALGSDEAARLTQQAQMRFPVALWENWWQPVADRLAATESWLEAVSPRASLPDGKPRVVHGPVVSKESSAASDDAGSNEIGFHMPPASVFIVPFSSTVGLWNLGRAGLSAVGAKPLAESANAAFTGILGRLANDVPTARPDVRSVHGALSLVFAVKPNHFPSMLQEANEQLYQAQNEFYSRNAVPMLPLGGVATVFRKAAEAYLVQHGHAVAKAKRFAWEREVFCWASVHANGSSHALHNHELSSVSGVLYLDSLPEGAGQLRFVDPRGDDMLAAAWAEATNRTPPLPTPPFVRPLVVKPAAGQLVLFPGWLRHEVTMSTFGETGLRRLSASCNLHGEWKDTATSAIEFHRGSEAEIEISPAATCKSEGSARSVEENGERSCSSEGGTQA